MHDSVVSLLQFKNLMLSIDPADEDSDDETSKAKVSSYNAAGQHTFSPLKVNPNPISSGPVVVLNKIDPPLNGSGTVPLDMLPKLNSLPNSHHTTPNDVCVLGGEDSNDASKVSSWKLLWTRGWEDSVMLEMQKLTDDPAFLAANKTEKKKGSQKTQMRQ